jgi:NADH dehydrogenase
MEVCLTLPHVIVVGGGFGGLATIRTLRRAPVRITLIDKRNHHLFQPLLYQVATASLAPSDIAEPLRVILAKQANVDVLLAEVTAIDTARRVVTADGRELTYDHLVVATGARASYFGHDAWAAHAPGLKTIGDALAIRRKILMAFERADLLHEPAERAKNLTFVVIGGGPTGVEMAGAIREIALASVPTDFRHIHPRDVRVILVEGGQDLLPPFPADLRASARAQLEGLGVEVRTGVPVRAIEEGVVLLGDERIDAATIVWAAGVRGSALGAALGAPLDRAGRVIVEPDCAIPGHPEVRVIGDLAHYAHGRDAPLPGVAPVAITMGQYVGQAILDDLAGKPHRTLRYLDKGSLATVGYSLAVAAIGRVHLSGVVAWLIWVFVHLMTLVGHRNRVVVFVKWAWAWAVSDRSSRLLWQDEAERDGASAS